jgi:hypothetical protein
MTTTAENKRAAEMTGAIWFKGESMQLHFTSREIQPIHNNCSDAVKLSDCMEAVYDVADLVGLGVDGDITTLLFRDLSAKRASDARRRESNATYTPFTVPDAKSLTPAQKLDLLKKDYVLECFHVGYARECAQPPMSSFPGHVPIGLTASEQEQRRQWVQDYIKECVFIDLGKRAPQTVLALATRQLVVLRHSGCCACCGHDLLGTCATVDHMEPFSANKFQDIKSVQVKLVNTIFNLQPLCFSCHQHKNRCDASNHMNVDVDLAIDIAHCLGYQQS